MSRARVEKMLRLYPAQWRARYGEELAGLIVESTGGERVPWRTTADVLAGAVRERWRAAGLGRDGAPQRRVAAGIATALGAWWLFVIGALSVLKFSEHWRDAVPGDSRTAPTVAYDLALAAAGAAGLLVLVGVGLGCGSLVRFLRAGGWRSIRRSVLTAAGLSASAAAGIAALAHWARTLDPGARNGHDFGYAAAFVVVAAVGALALLAWTVAGIRTVRRLPLSDSVLRRETWVLAGLALAMSVVIASVAVWWADRATAWPPHVPLAADRSSSSPFAVLLIAGGAAMLAATVVTGYALAHSVRAVRLDAGRGRTDLP
jgi:hypothetical protein